MEKKKRGRGANYTEEEKSLLAELVTNYKHIIEDKRTGGVFINKKKEAWRLVTFKYNSNCTTGARETEQLKALYDNMKQKSRKIVAANNKMEYVKGNTVTQEDVEKAIKNFKEDKVQMNKTGGGFWKPKSTDCNSKILAVIQKQIEPLPNPNDSAAAYFKKIDNLHVEDLHVEDLHVEDLHVEDLHVEDTALASTSSAPVQETNDFPYLSKLGQDNINTIEMTPAESIVMQKDQDLSKQENITKIVTTPSQGRVVKKKQAISALKKIKKDNSAEGLKRLYFKKKCQNAQLERKKLALEIIQMREEHRLKMEILKRKILNK